MAAFTAVALLGVLVGCSAAEAGGATGALSAGVFGVLVGAVPAWQALVHL